MISKVLMWVILIDVLICFIGGIIAFAVYKFYKAKSQDMSKW